MCLTYDQPIFHVQVIASKRNEIGLFPPYSTSWFCLRNEDQVVALLRGDRDPSSQQVLE